VDASTVAATSATPVRLCSGNVPPAADASAGAEAAVEVNSPVKTIPCPVEVGSAGLPWPRRRPERRYESWTRPFDAPIRLSP
jgi:hypothetical protein